MGKLVDKLRQVGQASGSRLGFMGRSTTPVRKPRPAAVLVMLKAGDVAGAEAAAKAGVDGVLISGWAPNSDIGGVKSALEAGGTLWGVEFAGNAGADGALKSAAEVGASFALVGPKTPAAVLWSEVEQLDLVVSIEPPRDDLSLLLLRAENLLPAQVAIVPLPEDVSSLSKMAIGEFVRLRYLFETLRFPAMVIVKEAPDADTTKALVHLGVDGIIISGTGSKPETLAKQVQALGEILETIPIQQFRHSTVTIGGFTASAIDSTLPGRPGQPEPEPDEE